LRPGRGEGMPLRGQAVVNGASAFRTVSAAFELISFTPSAFLAGALRLLRKPFNKGLVIICERIISALRL